MDFVGRNKFLVLFIGIAIAGFIFVAENPYLLAPLLEFGRYFLFGLIFSIGLFGVFVFFSWVRNPEQTVMVEPRGGLKSADIPPFRVNFSYDLISVTLYVMEFILGRVLYKFSKWPSAFESLNKAVKIGRKSQNRLEAAYFFRGNSQYVLKDYESAIRSYNLAIANDASYAALFFCRGMALSQIEDYRSAFTDFGRAVTLSPDLSGLIINRLGKEKPEALNEYYARNAEHKKSKTFNERQSLMFLGI